MIKAIIGLGNAGKEYQKTYHNVGAFGSQLFEERSEREGLTFKFFKLKGFMNTIGIPVVNFLKENNLLPNECVVIKDDSDLPVGSYKLVKGGGSAGHKGAGSIIVHATELSDMFWWLKIGIRDPKEQVRKKAEEFVLKEWSRADEEKFEEVLEKAWSEILKL